MPPCLAERLKDVRITNRQRSLPTGIQGSANSNVYTSACSTWPHFSPHSQCVFCTSYLEVGGTDFSDQAAVCRPRTRPLPQPPTASEETQLVALKSHMASGVSPDAPRDGAVGRDVWGDEVPTVARWGVAEPFGWNR